MHTQQLLANTYRSLRLQRLVGMPACRSQPSPHTLLFALQAAAAFYIKSIARYKDLTISLALCAHTHTQTHLHKCTHRQRKIKDETTKKKKNRKAVTAKPFGQKANTHEMLVRMNEWHEKECSRNGMQLDGAVHTTGVCVWVYNKYLQIYTAMEKVKQIMQPAMYQCAQHMW